MCIRDRFDIDPFGDTRFHITGSGAFPLSDSGIVMVDGGLIFGFSLIFN